MSTTLEGRKAKKKKAYAEFDEYISYQLRKTQTGIRSTDIFTALCGAAVFVLSYLLVFVVLDHWVVAGGFGNGMRAVLLVGMIVGTLAWIGWKVVWPVFRRVNSLYAAKALEEASPELKSTLLNYVDLRAANREVAPAIIGSMEKRAAVTLSHTEVEDAIDRSTLLRLSYALLAAVVLFSVYSVVSPKKVWPSIVRIFAPTSEVSVSTQTAFLNVDPGDTKVLAREFLTVTADLSGELPEEVTLLYTTADQQFVDEAVAMREVEAGLKRYQCILKGDGGEGLLQGLSYRIVAGDASTKTYNVTVTQPPSATVDELRYSFPDYMELPPESPTGSNIDTWEGTKIEIAATANMVVDSAKLQFSDEAEFPDRCEEIRMKVGGDGTSLTGLWQPIIRDDGTYPRFYRIQCRTKDGATDPTPAVHAIQIRPDEKPEISMLQPRGDMEVAINATVPLLINASDPDFRLSRVVFRAMIGKRQLPHREIYKGTDTEQRVLHELKIGDLHAQPGDVITWWAEAHDNRRVETPVRILLDENRSSTPRLKFIVRAPIPEEEAKEQLERDKERAQEKLDELDQRPGGDDFSSEDRDPNTPDRESGSEVNPPSKVDNRDPSDKPEPEENSTNEQNSEGDESGTGGKGKGENNPESNSDGEGGNETGDSDSEQSKAGAEGTDSQGSDAESKPDGSKSESGPRKPVSNDGSQDDEILKELLKQDRQSKPDGSRGEGSKKEGGNDQSSADRPEGKKPDSPDSETVGEDSGTDSSASKDGDTKDEGGPDGQKDNPSSKNPDGNSPEKDMPSDGGKDLPKGDEPPKKDGNSEPTENPEKSAGGDDPSKTDDPSGTAAGDESADPDSGDANNTGKNGAATGSEKPGDPSAMPESENPKSENASDGDGTDGSKGDSSSQSPDDPNGKGNSTKPGESNDGDGGKDSKPGQSSKSDQQGKPGGDSSGGKGSSSSDGGPSDTDKGDTGQSSSKDGSKSGAGGESADKPPASGASKSQDGGKPGSDSASGKPGEEGAEPGDSQKAEGGEDGKPKGNESGSKSGGEGSEDGGGQESGKADGSKSGKGDSPGEPGGKPGEGDSGGSTINDGAPGSGKSNAKSGKPGQGTGSKPSNSSDPGGEAVASPDDNANPDEAVQRPNSGANPVNQNVKDADQANLEDKLKASNMVLKRLKEELERGEVDPELLKKLGWTEKDMQRFAERLERQLAEPKPDDPAAEARRRQFEEVLRNVDLESSGRQKTGNFSNQKSTNNFSDRRLPAPRSHRKAYEDYIKRLSQQRRGAASSPSSK